MIKGNRYITKWIKEKHTKNVLMRLSKEEVIKRYLGIRNKYEMKQFKIGYIYGLISMTFLLLLVKLIILKL